MTSPSTLIRDAIADRLTGLPWLPVKTIRRQPRPQIPETGLPALLVILVDETETPEDEANTGEPRFVSDIVIGISVVIGQQSPEALDADLDDIVDRIRSTLLCDPTFVRRVDPALPEDDPERYPLFEAVAKVRRGRLFPPDGATYFAEGRLELTFRTRTFYAPDLNDAPDLDLVAVTGPRLGTTPNAPVVRARIALPHD